MDIEDKVRVDCYNRGYEQGEKDAAKEIYGRVLELIPILVGYQKFIDDFEGWLKERYGVEVE